jgi:integrase
LALSEASDADTTASRNWALPTSKCRFWRDDLWRPSDKHWDAEESAGFLAATAGDRLQPPSALLLDTGCRRGEACALRWTAASTSTPGR